MNMYGDYANIVVLKKHLEDQGFSVNVDELDIGETVDINLYDFIYMGSGTESKQSMALDDIRRYRDIFNKSVNNNKTILFTGNAMELLGKSIDGRPALGIFDFETRHVDKRYTGDVIVKNRMMGEVVGFVNKSTQIIGDDKYKLFDYVFKDDNLNDNNYEGYTVLNTFATHIIGPILVKNPNFMRLIIERIAPADFSYIETDYKYEEKSYNITLDALKERMQWTL